MKMLTCCGTFPNYCFILFINMLFLMFSFDYNLNSIISFFCLSRSVDASRKLGVRTLEAINTALSSSSSSYSSYSSSIGVCIYL